MPVCRWHTYHAPTSTMSTRYVQHRCMLYLPIDSLGMSLDINACLEICCIMCFLWNSIFVIGYFIMLLCEYYVMLILLC